jgi:hypothetical protein
VEVKLYVFLTNAPDGGEWSISRPDGFVSEERALGTNVIYDWLHPKAGLKVLCWNGDQCLANGVEWG